MSRVLVSTDDEEIASVARDYGADAPFLRPSELAQDRTTDLPVFEHALKWLEDIEGYKPDIVIQLRPTSPIRPKDCIDSAVQDPDRTSRCRLCARRGPCRAKPV